MIISGCLSPLQQFLRNGPLERDRRHSTCTRRLVSFTRGGTTYLIRTRPSKYCTLSPKYLYTHFQSLISSVPSVKSFYDFFSRTFSLFLPTGIDRVKLHCSNDSRIFTKFFSPLFRNTPRQESRIKLHLRERGRSLERHPSRFCLRAALRSSIQVAQLQRSPS